jgi:hypothetical protein
MTDQEVLSALDDRQTLALTAWGEARQIPRDDPDSHSPIESLVAVMCVVRNRLLKDQKAVAGGFLHPHGGLSYKSICLAPAQFSCWTAGSGSNHDALMAQAHLLLDESPQPVGAVDTEVRECLYLADGVIANTIIDRTGGATSYWAPASMVPPGRVPTWAEGKPTTRIGDQLFL